MKPEIKALYEETEKLCPELFKEVYPKRIIPPSGNFLNPKLYAASAAGIVMSSQLGMTKRNYVVGGIDLAVQRLIELKVPTYFVHEEFFKAVAATQLPENFELNQLKWPLESLLLCLPLKETKQIFGREIPWICLSHIPSGDYQPKYGTIRTNFPLPRLAIHFPVFENDLLPTDYGGMYPEDKPLKEFLDSCPWIDDLAELKGCLAKVDPDEDKRINNRAINIGLQLLLGMAAVPEFIETEKIIRPAKTHTIESKSLDALWSPNTIGRKFKLQKPSPTIGERHSPRVHMRRGHFTHQHYGSKNSLIKIKWLLPCWVGLKD